MILQTMLGASLLALFFFKTISIETRFFCLHGEIYHSAQFLADAIIDQKNLKKRSILCRELKEFEFNNGVLTAPLSGSLEQNFARKPWAQE
jgi:hypothetical protein